MAPESVLLKELAEVLPLGQKFQLYHVSTRPAPCEAIFSARPAGDPQPTTRESHLVAITTAVAREVEHEVFVFAIEVFIYATDDLTTIFISKADTTGFLKLLGLPRSSSSLAQQVSTAFVSRLIDNRDRRQRTVVSLFARAQDQYLFPGSVENGLKRVLDDRALIKWWSETLDPILRRYNADYADCTSSKTPEEHKETASAYLVVPGCEIYETKSFFPKSVKHDPPDHVRWRANHPLYQLTDGVPEGPPRCLIPRFPDDPKARFLDQLDEEIAESSDASGYWRSVKSLEQFWEMMAYRQECSAGRLVGFFWLLITCDASKRAINNRSSQNMQSGGSHHATLTPLPTSHSQSQVKDKDSTLSDPLDSKNAAQGGETLDPSTSKAKTLSEDEQEGSPLRGIEHFSQEQYDELISHLLELSFSSLSEATTSTSDFVAFAKNLTKHSSLGETVVGTKLFPTSLAKENSNSLVSGINCLNSSLIKKRKKTSQDTSASLPEGSSQKINTLSAGLVRKKPKQSSP